ncbi:MAG: LysE family transporter [Deltaproteobacteria bacterium]|nr:MAG: LysE family transporter [Deltaproteobacteria bacterium]
MRPFLIVVSAFMLGFVAAIPAGPVQIEVARRSINGRLESSLMVILGAFVVDIFYGVIAFFGIAPFLEKKAVMAVFWLVGAAFLLTLSFVVIKDSAKHSEFDAEVKHLTKKRWGLVSGLTLSVVNPMMILWWLMGQRLFMDIGLITDFTDYIAVSFLLAGGVGLASYLTLLSVFLYWTKRFISLPKMRWINLSFGVVLFLLAVYFAVMSIQALV